MKTIKKLMSIVIVLFMTIVFSSKLYADDTKGTITISNATVGQTYTLYKVFDATVVSGRKAGEDGISYTSTWNLGVNDYFEIVNGNVKAKDAAKDTQGNLSSGAISYLKSKINSFTKIGSIPATSTNVVFQNLEPGYYYISTTTGTVVTVNSITPNISVIDKNEGNQIDKEQKGGDTTSFTKENITADIGDVVDYKISVTIQPNSENVVVYDVLDSGLTLDTNSNPVISIDSNNYNLDAFSSTSVEKKYSYNEQPSGTDKTKSVSGNIIISFKNGWLNSLTNVTTVTVEYKAIVNENSVVNTDIKNTVNLVYGHNYDMTSSSDTVLKNYQIDLTKIDKDDSTKKLKGAEFKLFDSETGGNEIPLVLVSGTGTSSSDADNVYRHAKEGEEAVTIVTGSTGKVIIKGLQNGSYYFEETVAPSGYNKLVGRTAVATISNANATISVQNAKGAKLPSTGGIGTTIFHVAGAALIIGAGLLLVSKKRLEK